VNGFTKLHANIVTSSLWTNEDNETRLVWVAMLALADARGCVVASIPGLAHVARIPIAKTEAAIATFLAPDKWSRSKEHEGRRIEEIEGGWRLLNYEKYREGRDPEIRREQVREAVQRHRARNPGKPDVITVSQGKPPKAQAEAEAKEEAELKTLGEGVRPSGAKAPRSQPVDDEGWLKSLEADPAYSGINIRGELGKMNRWCEANRRQATRRRFINWLNRADRPLQTDAPRGADYSKGF
jgi:hypothetical protein